jgi:hypothetical protein
VFYCKDAFDGLHTMDRIVSGEGAELWEEQQRGAKRRKQLKATR